jgi:predicted nucleic acid-binding protein
LTSVVIDASALLAWLLADDQSIAGRFDTLLADETGAQLIAPALIIAETANALRVGVRRGRLASAQAHQAATIADELGIELDHDIQGIRNLMTIASHHGLTAYDALYLELAMRHGVPLLTADAELVRAAGEAGVETASFPVDVRPKR